MLFEVSFRHTTFIGLSGAGMLGRTGRCKPGSRLLSAEALYLRFAQVLRQLGQRLRARRGHHLHGLEGPRTAKFTTGRMGRVARCLAGS